MRITPTHSFLAALVAAAVLTGCGSSGIGDILGGPSGSDGRYDPYDQRAGDVQGTVDRVDSRNRLIYVDSEGTDGRYNLRNGNGGEMVLSYDDQTTVEHQGRTFRPEDLERGDRIRADVEGTGDRLFAQQIEVLYDVTSGGSGSYQGQDDTRDYRDLRGTVRSVDTRDRTLELETSRYGSGFAPDGSSSRDRYNSNDVVLVQYDNQTIVEFEGQRYKPENLERGDVVEVQIRDLGGRRLAERITVVGENQPVGR